MWSLAGMASGTRLKTQIAQMDDASQLRQVAHLLDAENRRLHERLAKLTAELAALKGKSAPQQLSLELMRLQEQLAVMQQRMFGASSERSAGSEPRKRSLKTDSQEPQRGHGPTAQPTLPPSKSGTSCRLPSRPAASATERWKRWASRPRTRKRSRS